MGRATRTLLLALLVCLLLPATALAVDGDGETTFRKILLPADHGLSARFEADDDEIELTITRRGKGQLAFYFAEGEVSAEGVSVKFGRLGEFVADYQPFRTLNTHGPRRHCTGEPKTSTEGYFRGSIRFRGEGGYVNIDAARVRGRLYLQPKWDCDFRRARASRADEDEATLAARSRRNPISFGAFGSQEDENSGAWFFASSSEHREGVSIGRYTFAASGRGFEFDNARGTALIHPPAPFGGSARYLRRPGAPDSWRGSLTAPLLGLGRVHLAGPGFVAKMVPQLPNIE
jgi:hypothetical protein